MLAPYIDNSLLEGTTGRSIIIEAGHTAVNLNNAGQLGQRMLGGYIYTKSVFVHASKLGV